MSNLKITEGILRVKRGENLGSEFTSEVFDEIMSGIVSVGVLTEFLIELSKKGETVEEIAGAASAMRRRAVFIDAGARTCVDTCGTGGDGLDTFNVSTVSAFIAAGAGVNIAKHGNRAATGKCGSADVLAKLGFNLDVHPSVMEQCLQENGIAFLFAPKMHPAMRYASDARKAAGRRTIFNLLGPLVNPAGARGRLTGVFSSGLTEIFAKSLLRLGCTRAFVVHGGDGMDEITVCDSTRVSEVINGSVKTYELNPQTFGIEISEASALAGGDADVNARIAREILDGSRSGGARDICILNAGAAVVAGGVANTLQDGIKLAKVSLESGAAQKKLYQLIEYSRQ